MKLLKERDSDGFFTVSNAFTDTFLGLLSGDAVKLYLYVKRCYSDGNEFFIYDASQALRIGRDECESALEELVLAGIVIVDGDNVILTADSSLRDAGSKRADDEFRRKLKDKTWEDNFKEAVRSINNEFFAGRMNPKWYDFIKKCAGEYGFQPETIYILFASCKSIRDERGTGANFFSYVSRVAENWYADKIVTPDDVAEREKRTGAAREYVAFVKKKINFTRPFTQQEQAVIEEWQKKGVTADMLAVLLDDTNRVKAFTIGRINGQVEKWVELGFKDAADVRKYYETLLAERNAQKARTGNNGTAGNAGKTPAGSRTRTDTQKHFKGEREYDDSFFSQLENRDKK